MADRGFAETAAERAWPPLAVETMRTLLVCRGPIAFETLEIYRQRRWHVPHVVISAKEWIADLSRSAPWIAGLPAEQVHYIQEYDDVDTVIRIATEHGLDAIYPGYGFLAENAAFAARVEAAGLRFIGPTPETLRAVGDKDAAIALARQLGIPTIPGDDTLIAFARTHDPDDTAAETVRRILDMAQRHPGYPIRLKHPAGGGGKGQRVLTPEVFQDPAASDLICDALHKVWSEMGVSATEANARKGVLLELNVPRPLHWEVQLLGDGETVVHFAARDCSLQNHGYQKFIEVALHPQAIAEEIARLDAPTAAGRIASLRQRQATLERICSAAVRLGQAVHLRGAATVEFLIDLQGEPYFLEVNPRIQVEHAVTEGIARVQAQPISLVELQQRIAAGEKLPFQQADITFVGDAIEVRLNAWHEDLSPVLGGVVHSLRLASPAAADHHIRIDASGLLQRQHPWVVPSYDANFALIIVSGTHRHDALRRLLDLLENGLAIHGSSELYTNLQPLLGLLTLMHALPAETEFRTDTSLLWMALAAVIAAQKPSILSLLPTFPRRLEAYHAAVFARLLRATLDKAFLHPSGLLKYYIKRLTQRVPRPLAPLEVLWQLAAELAVPLFEEEVQQGAALQQAADLLWATVEQSAERFTAVLRAGQTASCQDHPEFHAVCQHLLGTTPGLTEAEASQLLQVLAGWLGAEVPALGALIKVLERTQLHTLLAVQDDLSLSPPSALQDGATVSRLHRLLSRSLRPAVLRHGELLSPMEATIYHAPEPGAPPFVEIGAEIKVGQTLALLEAMKMFTELPSPVDGVLVAVLVESGQGVKTGTPLFQIATQDTTLEATADGFLPALDDVWLNRFGVFVPQGDVANG